MTTDIHGCIEVRYPFADQDYWSDEEPWTVAMDLFPLLTDQSYAAFGCLFGVRNHQGWIPVAEDRGMPADASTELRERVASFEPSDIHGLTWVNWAELSDLDMAVRPPVETRGRREASGPVLTYGAPSRAEVIGPGSGWEHVFAVMKALAGRFGDEGVRLVVHFA
ncbi:hypothetical protein ACFQZ4_25090 [Catellatospora coxensis]|uniref:DUF1877 family protein n=1 Tax=Catellatospora coxensis TaxID=310354 RepID=A0A8J3KYV3_9ACTN|nr:hypothetical protein [Catellatospora coxensis]GIG05571.1 hypothetical protein Cco03nite_22710 [Catellatospora coxensis]